MYAGHMAAGLALRGRARRVPVAVYLIAAFLLDILWIAFGVLRLDSTALDDWSHSLLLSVVWASAFAAAFWRLGRMAVFAVWLAVFSHFVLDLVVQGASLFPNQRQSEFIPVLIHGLAGRLFQAALCVGLLLLFARDERNAGQLSWRTWAACGLVLSLNLRFLLHV